MCRDAIHLRHDDVVINENIAESENETETNEDRKTLTFALQNCCLKQQPTSEVFNLCHAVDPTESSGGGPHGPRHTGFNLSYSWLGQNMSY